MNYSWLIAGISRYKSLVLIQSTSYLMSISHLVAPGDRSDAQRRAPETAAVPCLGGQVLTNTKWRFFRCRNQRKNRTSPAEILDLHTPKYHIVGVVSHTIPMISPWFHHKMMFFLWIYLDSKYIVTSQRLDSFIQNDEMIKEKVDVHQQIIGLTNRPFSCRNPVAA